MGFGLHVRPIVGAARPRILKNLFTCRDFCGQDEYEDFQLGYFFEVVVAAFSGREGTVANGVRRFDNQFLEVVPVFDNVDQIDLNRSEKILGAGFVGRKVQEVFASVEFVL